MVATKTSTRKSKGRGFQQEIREDLIKTFDIDPINIKSTGMGQAGCDIYLSKSSRKKFPFGIEAKFQEKMKLWPSINQCEDNAEKEGLNPLLLFRKSRSKTYAVIEWDLLKLLMSYMAYAEEYSKLTMKDEMRKNDR